MPNLNATLSHIQGNILITLDGPDGTVAESSAVQTPLTVAQEAGLLPGPIDGFAGNRDTVLVLMTPAGCGHAAPVSDVEDTAKAVKAVLNTAGIETAMDGTFDRARRYEEHWGNFVETAAEEISIEKTA